MRILIVLPTAFIGGAERVLFNIAYELLTRGHFVKIYVMSRGRQPGWDVIVSHPRCEMVIRDFVSEKTSLFSFAASMFKLSRKFKPDLVISSHTHINAALSIMRKIKILKCDRLVSRESTFIFERFFGVKRLVFKALYKFFYGSQDLLIFQTPDMEKSLEAALGFRPVREFIVLENPVSLQFIDAAIGGAAPVDRKSNRIVACGRLIEIKGFDNLISAFKEVNTVYPGFVLEIIGDGPERLRLEQLVQDLELEASVFFRGRVDNPFVYYRGATLGIVSSLKEGFPNVLIEMMASGVGSLIATPCTDGVYSLPNVKVTSGFDRDSLFLAIDEILKCYEDKSEKYRCYVESDRSIGGYLDEVFRACHLT